MAKSVNENVMACQRKYLWWQTSPHPHYSASVTLVALHQKLLPSLQTNDSPQFALMPNSKVNHDEHLTATAATAVARAPSSIPFSSLPLSLSRSHFFRVSFCCCCLWGPDYAAKCLRLPTKGAKGCFVGGMKGEHSLFII